MSSNNTPSKLTLMDGITHASPNKSILNGNTLSGEEYLNESIFNVEQTMHLYAVKFASESGAYFTQQLHSQHAYHTEILNQTQHDLNGKIGLLENEVQVLKDEIASKNSDIANFASKNDAQRLSYINYRYNSIIKYISPYSMKNIFIAWRNRTKRSLQNVKTDKKCAKNAAFLLKSRYFGLFVQHHVLLKHDKTLTEIKFKYDTISNEVSGDIV
jgi:hypothetical protein